MLINLLVFASLLLSSLQVSAIASAVPAPDDLFLFDATDVPAENGKRLNMTLRELIRKPGASIVEVTFVSGGSVSSSMFVLRGMCALMQVRGAKFFASIPVSKIPQRYEVTFPKAVGMTASRGSSQKVFSESDCALLDATSVGARPSQE